MTSITILDKQTLKNEKFNPVVFLQQLDCKITEETKKKIKFNCNLTDKEHPAEYFKSTNTFMCSTCMKAGNAIKYLSLKENITDSEATKLIANMFQYEIGTTQSDIEKQIRNIKDPYEKTILGLSLVQQRMLQKALNNDEKLKQSLNLTPETINIFNLGYINKNFDYESIEEIKKIVDTQKINAILQRLGLIKTNIPQNIPNNNPETNNETNDNIEPVTQIKEYKKQLTIPIIHDDTMIGFYTFPGHFLTNPNTKVYRTIRNPKIEREIKFFIFGEHKTKEHIFKTNQVIITFDPLHLIHLYQMGIKNTVCFNLLSHLIQTESNDFTKNVKIERLVNSFSYHIKKTYPNVTDFIIMIPGEYPDYHTILQNLFHELSINIKVISHANKYLNDVIFSNNIKDTETKILKKAKSYVLIYMEKELSVAKQYNPYLKDTQKIKILYKACRKLNLRGDTVTKLIALVLNLDEKTIQEALNLAQKEKTTLNN